MKWVQTLWIKIINFLFGNVEPVYPKVSDIIQDAITLTKMAKRKRLKLIRSTKYDDIQGWSKMGWQKGSLVHSYSLSGLFMKYRYRSMSRKFGEGRSVLPDHFQTNLRPDIAKVLSGLDKIHRGSLRRGVKELGLDNRAFKWDPHMLELNSCCSGLREDNIIFFLADLKRLHGFLVQRGR